MVGEAHPVGRVPSVSDGDEPVLEATIGHYPEGDSYSQSGNAGSDHDWVGTHECDDP